MLAFTEKVYGKKSSSGSTYLVGDIGGTNSTFAFVEEKENTLILLVTLHYKSKEISDFTSIVKEVVSGGEKKYNFHPTAACFAGAGVVSEKNDHCTITKLAWNIDARKIERKTSLRSVLIINDFIAVAYGIEKVSAQNRVVLKSGKLVPCKPKVILGAGTGLGKAILIWNNKSNRYFPVASEGGHSDAALQVQEEFEFAEFIKKKYARVRVVWEDMLSGKGISNIYQFLESVGKYSSSKYSLQIKKSNYDPALISTFQQDSQCKATLDIFLRVYARCAQNLALDTVALGGIYLAGGITAKNVSLFKRKAFIDEFILNHRMKKVLEQIPIFAITDYNVSLYGAAHALKLYLQGEFP